MGVVGCRRECGAVVVLPVHRVLPARGVGGGAIREPLEEILLAHLEVGEVPYHVGGAVVGFFTCVGHVVDVKVDVPPILALGCEMFVKVAHSHVAAVG